MEDRKVTGPAGRRLQSYLPRGNTLDPESFGRRHRLLRWILGLHLPALFLFGIWQGVEAEQIALGLVVPACCLVLASHIRAGRPAAFFVAAGLVYCSATLVHLSGGMIEAHFHFFILLGFIALYQDWVPFIWNVVFVVASHGFGSTLASDAMFNHHAAHNRPWLWAGIHGVAVLAACVGMIMLWYHTELAQRRSLVLQDQLAGARLTAAELGRRQAVSAVLVNLARRNQVLLDQQLTLISGLEKQERQPDALDNLFRLEHLATRMRRNAESLLVLSGDEPQRRWGRPIPLADVVRAAAAEVADYARVEVLVTDHLEIDGRAVTDITHLLAELIENATSFSPSGTPIRVHSYLWPDRELSSGFLISVEDHGIGMSEDQFRDLNRALAAPPEVDTDWRTLGLQVVSRLARRHGLEVRLAPTPGAGVTALVTMPSSLIHHRRTPAIAPAEHSPPAAPATPPEGERIGHFLPAVASRAAPGSATSPTPRAALASVDPPWPAPPDADPWSPPLTVDGLARRVPGQRLAAGLRRPAAGSAAPEPPDRRAPGRARAPSDETGSRDRLSRFQASQRAGRMAAQDRVSRNGEGADRGRERPNDAAPEE